MRKFIKNIIKAMLLALPLLFTGCICQTISKGKTNYDAPVITLEQKCFGHCQNYKVELFLNDSIKVYPKENFSVKVKSGSQMKHKTAGILVADAEKMMFWDLNDVYESKLLQDAPTTYITVDFKGKSKKIKVKGNATQELNEFIKKIKTIVKTSEWHPLP